MNAARLGRAGAAFSPRGIAASAKTSEVRPSDPM
jgi:hypothetical protein